MKKTKIVSTIGPASENPETIIALAQAGVNIVRLNFSHGDFAEHQPRVDGARAASEKLGQPLEILQDLGGPKIRIGMFAVEPVELVPGARFTLTTDTVEGTVDKVSVNYKPLATEVKVGEMIFLNDGKQKLQVVEINGNDVVTEVISGGSIKSKRGVNLPDSSLSIKALTDKDIADLEFGVQNKVDYMALSFVRSAQDIADLRKILDDKGCTAKIIAKVETPQAIKDIDAIIAAADGIMVARGDLAIEVPFERVPAYQKMMVKKCNEAGKFIIVATQMMESMMNSSQPSRADVSDVYNAVLDGADAVMTSGETAQRENPVDVIVAMTKVIVEAEKAL